MTVFSRVILGTAQLGMPYGIANIHGQPNIHEASAIVELAHNSGIHSYDTAQAYGQSESVLGLSLKKLPSTCSDLRIITKCCLPPEPDKTEDVSAPLGASFEASLEASFRASLDTLGLKKLFCLMLHNENQLALLHTNYKKMLCEFCDKGIIEHLGCSVYTPEKAKEALKHPLISIVQIPASLFDRRFENAGIFELAHTLKKTLHVRSVFLQGVLLMPAEKIPQKLQELAPYVQIFHALCADFGQNPASVALGWALARWQKACILFGVETRKQLENNLQGLTDTLRLTDAQWQKFTNIAVPQKDALFNPSLWNI